MIDSPPISIWLGYDPAETLSFAVARYSIRRFEKYIPIKGVVLDQLIKDGFYWREIERRRNPAGKSQLWDPISGAWMSTEFAISRFLVPCLAGYGWALFADSDIMVRKNICRLFEHAYAQRDKAVLCVKHNYDPPDTLKKDAKMQAHYPRKNWSSVMLFNCEHPANKRLSLEMINSLPGRDLHRFCWLNDNEIGELPPEWNYLVGVTRLNGETPALVHFTEGLPDVPGYEQQDFADEWRAMRPYAVGAL